MLLVKVNEGPIFLVSERPTPEEALSSFVLQPNGERLPQFFE
jgi:hypothetical protein